MDDLVHDRDTIMKPIASTVAAMEQQQPYPTHQPRHMAPPDRPQRVQTDVLAIASLVLGVGSFVLMIFGPLASLPAVATGHLARSRIARLGGGGARLARWGLILGYVNLGLTALVLALGATALELASHHVWVAGHPLY